MVEIIFGGHQCSTCKKELDYAVDYQYKKFCINCYTKEIISYMHLKKLTAIDKNLKEKSKEIFELLQDKKRVSIWDTDDIRGSSEAKSGDKWLPMSVIKEVEKKCFENE